MKRKILFIAIITLLALFCYLTVGNNIICSNDNITETFQKGEQRLSVFSKVYKQKSAMLYHLITLNTKKGIFSIYASNFMLLNDYTDSPLFVFRDDILYSILPYRTCVLHVQSQDGERYASEFGPPIEFIQQVLQTALTSSHDEWTLFFNEYHESYDYGLAIAVAPIVLFCKMKSCSPLSCDSNDNSASENKRIHKLSVSETIDIGMEQSALENVFGKPFTIDEFGIYYYSICKTKTMPNIPSIPNSVLIRYNSERKVSTIMSWRMGNRNAFHTYQNDVEIHNNM